MNNNERQIPVSVLTNPWLIWLINHGWEDPGWGQTPIGQIGIATAIHELAAQLTDLEIKKQIQLATSNAVASQATQMVR